MLHFINTRLRVSASVLLLIGVVACGPAEETTLPLDSEANNASFAFEESSCWTTTPHDTLSILIPNGTDSSTSTRTYDSPDCDNTWIVRVTSTPTTKKAVATVNVTLPDGVPTNSADCLSSKLYVSYYATNSNFQTRTITALLRGQWYDSKCHLADNNDYNFSVGQGGFIGNRLILSRAAVQAWRPNGTQARVNVTVTAGPAVTTAQ